MYIIIHLRVRVLPRSGLRKVEARGLFLEARVVRGRDWKWKDQDGKHNQYEITIHVYHRVPQISPAR